MSTLLNDDDSTEAFDSAIKAVFILKYAKTMGYPRKKKSIRASTLPMVYPIDDTALRISIPSISYFDHCYPRLLEQAVRSPLRHYQCDYLSFVLSWPCRIDIHIPLLPLA